MKLVRRQTGTLKLLKPRLMRAFDLKRRVKDCSCFLCPAQLRWMEPLHICQHPKISTVQARGCTRTEGAPRCPSFFLYDWGMQAWSSAVSSTAERSSLFAFPLHLHTWFSLLSVKHGLCYKLLTSTRNRSEDSRLSLTNCFQQDFITLSAPWRFSPVIMLFAFPSPHLGLVCPLGRPKLAQSEVMWLLFWII